jgi:hypothetical protein
VYEFVVYVGANVAVAFRINALADKYFAPTDNFNGASVTLIVFEASPAMWVAVAARLAVIVDVPTPIGVINPVDEFIVATPGTLLEYDNAPVPTLLIKLVKLKTSLDAVVLLGILAK